MGNIDYFSGVRSYLLGEVPDKGVRGNLPGRDRGVGVLEQTEGGFGGVVAGLVYGAVKQDEVSPAASDV